MDTNIAIILIIIPTIIVALSHFILKIIYAIYRKKAVDSNLTGKEVATKILTENDLTNIRVGEINGELSDHYSNSKKVINLSTNIYNMPSIASVAVAAHECGHALQYKEGYSLIKIRNMLIPMVNIGSSLGYYVIGISLVSMKFTQLFFIGLFLISFALIFQILTLPVEFDASRRANKILLEMGIVTEEEQRGTKIMLAAAAFTYVAGLISALAQTTLQILRFSYIMGRRRK